MEDSRSATSPRLVAYVGVLHSHAVHIIPVDVQWRGQNGKVYANHHPPEAVIIGGFVTSGQQYEPFGLFYLVRGEPERRQIPTRQLGASRFIIRRLRIVHHIVKQERPREYSTFVFG